MSTADDCTRDAVRQWVYARIAALAAQHDELARIDFACGAYRRARVRALSARALRETARDVLLRGLDDGGCR